MKIKMVDVFEGKEDIRKADVDLHQVFRQNISGQHMAAMVNLIFDSLKFTIAIRDMSDKNVAVELLVEHKSSLPKLLKDWIFGKKVNFRIKS